MRLFFLPQIISLVIFLFPQYTFGQTNFRVGLEQTDPIPKDSIIDISERIKIHEHYLANALQSGDKLHQLYGNLYRFYDCLKQSNYETATNFLLQAEKIAEESGNVGWKGGVSYRRGVLNVRLDNEEKAKAAYENAAMFCQEAGDSLCWGESLEQIGAKNMMLDSFAAAEYHYKLALPLLEKFGSTRNLASLNSNWGAMFTLQNKMEAAIPFMQKGIILLKESGNDLVAVKVKNNLAETYRRLGKTDLAIKTFKDCIELNDKYNLPDNKVNNYLGLHEAYVDLENYKLALEYIEKYELLKDTLIGEETKQKIAILETKFNNAEKELALEKSKVELIATQKSLERTFGIIAFLCLIGGIGIWLWYRQNRRTKLQLLENQENLTQLTRILIEKNAQLNNLEQKEPTVIIQREKTSSDELEEDLNLYNHRILTNEDWTAFKVYFEKSYPNYIARLRATHPTLTEAQERLFLFLKLNLTKQEIADILGITIDSVKKTRTRLRKRLAMNSEDSLEEYVQAF